MVYFVADNIITSLGFSTVENFSAIRESRIGIKTINDKNIYPEPFPASLVDSRRLDEEFAKLSKKENFTRLEKMLILSVSDALNNSDIDIRSERTGIILSTTKGNIDLPEKQNNHGFEQDRLHLWKLGRVIADYFYNPNEPFVLSNACISGVLAINIAAGLIQQGKYDNIVVTGGDIVSSFVVSGFMSFMSLSPEPCKPFDEARDGLSLGEGAGTIIMSNKERAGENIIFLGGGSANDANHISGPSRTGAGSFFAIGRAFKEAGVNVKDIDYISAHGTATLYNDEMESIAIGRHNMEKIPVNSFKGNWGHTLGAAGIVETAMMFMEMKEDILLRSTGFEKLGVSVPVNVIEKTEHKSLNTCLKMASGFGGTNAALVVKKIKDQNQLPRVLTRGSNETIIIDSYCHIRNNHIYRDGALIFEAPGADLKEFLKSAYKFLKPGYTKFYKMDDLSKLGFLAAEVLSPAFDKALPPESTGIVLSNIHSNRITDTRHFETIADYENYFPSPAIFVYTLPNIMIGEISIRHKFQGENSFFIFEKFNPEFIAGYINQLIMSEKITACLGGYVDQSSDGYDVFVYYLRSRKKDEKKPEHTTGEVRRLYENEMNQYNR